MTRLPKLGCGWTGGAGSLIEWLIRAAFRWSGETLDVSHDMLCRLGSEAVFGDRFTLSTSWHFRSALISSASDMIDLDLQITSNMLFHPWFDFHRSSWAKLFGWLDELKSAKSTSFRDSWQAAVPLEIRFSVIFGVVSKIRRISPDSTCEIQSTILCIYVEIRINSYFKPGQHATSK